MIRVRARSASDAKAVSPDRSPRPPFSSRSRRVGRGNGKGVKVLAHPEDEACAAKVRRYLALAPVGDGVVLLVASADALADDAVLDEAVRAHRRGTLRLLLWR